MLINKFFMPDLYLKDIYEISPELLLSNGIKTVLLDIDNTLVTYDDAKPTDSVLSWLSSLSEKKINIGFISNNNKERVTLFNSELNYFATWDSGKPSTKCYLSAMKFFDSDKTNTAVIGDQIFTDVWSAKRLGLYAILVKPINDKKTLFFKTKRLLEKPILRRYIRRQRKNEA